MLRKSASWAVVLSEPQYRLGRPENYLFLSSTKTYFPDQSIQKTLDIFLETEALIIGPCTCTGTEHAPSARVLQWPVLLFLAKHRLGHIVFFGLII